MINAKTHSEQLFNLQLKSDQYARKLAEQRLRYEQLEKQWKEASEEQNLWRVKRNEKCQKGGGIYAVRTKLADQQRDLIKHENRLSACRTRESRLLSENQTLRTQVDALRADRILTQNLYLKQQKKIGEIRRSMQEVFKASTQTMADRDRVASQISTVSQVNNVEQEQFDHVFASLTAIIRREQESAEIYQKQAIMSAPIEIAEEYSGGGTLTSDKQILEHPKEIQILSRQDDYVDKHEDEMVMTQELEFAFKSIKNQLGIDDPNALLAYYSKKEDDIFQHFCYIQSINNEILHIEEDKQRFEDDIRRIEDDANNGLSQSRKHVMDNMAELLQTTLQEKLEFERLRASASREFQACASSLDRIYTALGPNGAMQRITKASDDDSCNSRSNSTQDKSHLLKMNSLNNLLIAHGITEGNVLQFLEVVEQRISELLEYYTREQGNLNARVELVVEATRKLNKSTFRTASTNDKSFSPEAGNRTSMDYTSPEEAARHNEKDFALSIMRRLDTDISDEEDISSPLSKQEIQHRAQQQVNSLQRFAKGQLTGAKGMFIKRS